MSTSNSAELSPQNISQRLNYIRGSSNQVLWFQNANSRRYAVRDGTEWEWWSRENRKGRHILLNDKQAPSHAERTTRLLRALTLMITVIAWWDVSWWIGILFTVGSLCSITAGVMKWLPIAYPSIKLAADPTVVSGIISFIRAMFFLVGGMLLVVEAVNANQSDCFGWAIKEALDLDSEDTELHSTTDEEKAGGHKSGLQPDHRNCTHFHNPHRMKHRIMRTKTFKAEARPNPGPEQVWKWWPTWKDICIHHRHEIGFNANFITFMGAIIFWVTNLLTLPGIYDRLPQGVLYGLYYPSFLLGSIFFVISSILYILEVQRKWWKPAPEMVGWWVGMTNLVGSVGWAWSGCLGYCSSSWCEYQRALTLVWAPAVYLVGSLLLIYEAVEKWPIHIAGS